MKDILLALCSSLGVCAAFAFMAYLISKGPKDDK